MSAIKLTILTENNAVGGESRLKAEHGLSVFIETDELNILFDTGASSLFYSNSRKLDIELFGADIVVLSHGHYDHAGGLPKALSEASRASVCLHKDALRHKFKKTKEGILKYIGIQPEVRKSLENAENAGRVKWVFDYLKLSDSITLFSSGGKAELPDDWPFFQEEEDGRDVPDRMIDEVSMLIEGDCASALIVGCSHPGLVHIYKKAAELASKPIAAIIGGSHLVAASDKEIGEIAAYFENKNLELYLGHCTSIHGYAQLCRYIPKKLHPLNAGLAFNLAL